MSQGHTRFQEGWRERAPRFEIRVRVVVELSDLASAQGTVRNLSPNGVFIEGTFAPVRPGAEVGLRFSLSPDSSRERFEARVTRVAEGGFAARFQRLTATQIRALWMAFLEDSAATGQLDDCGDLDPAETRSQSLDVPSVE